MVVCSNCNNENDDSEEYCIICGAKLSNSNIIQSQNIPIFSTEDTKEISINETLNKYYKELKEKIKKQEEVLESLENDPLFEKHNGLIKVEEENNILKSQIKNYEDEINKLNNNDSKFINDLKSEIDELKSLNESYLKANEDLNLKIKDLKKANEEIGMLRIKVDNLESKNKTLQKELDVASKKEKLIMVCPNCSYKHNYKEDVNFCTECGFPFKKRNSFY